jgi:glycosyltransferase involved in cell wall biosynthesis
LVIAGEGAERDRVEYTIQDLGLGGRVRLLGKQSPDQVRALLRSSDVLLHASLSEGIANAVLEAMACGIPVVATGVGGLREAVDDGREGFLVPSRDFEAMSDRLALLLRDSKMRATFGAAARRRAVAQFDLRSQTGQFLALYNSLLPSC